MFCAIMINQLEGDDWSKIFQIIIINKKGWSRKERKEKRFYCTYNSTSVDDRQTDKQTGLNYQLTDSLCCSDFRFYST
jgi:hypothetical protein